MLTRKQSREIVERQAVWCKEGFLICYHVVEATTVQASKIPSLEMLRTRFVTPTSLIAGWLLFDCGIFAKRLVPSKQKGSGPIVVLKCHGCSAWVHLRFSWEDEGKVPRFAHYPTCTLCTGASMSRILGWRGRLFLKWRRQFRVKKIPRLGSGPYR